MEGKLDREIHTIEAATSALECECDRDCRVPFYCEENVWRVAYRHLAKSEYAITSLLVVFVSNEKKCVPMYQQVAAASAGKPCLWDYHVILLDCKVSGKPSIIDIDSHLPCPCPLDEYLRRTFPKAASVLPDYEPHFRVIDAHNFVNNFCSDRSHMRNEDGSWSAAPPTYKCIGRPSPTATFLSGLLCMKREEKEASRYGKVLSFHEFEKAFCKTPIEE